jgi:hypothetical protein
MAARANNPQRAFDVRVSRSVVAHPQLPDGRSVRSRAPDRTPRGANENSERRVPH